MIEGGFVVERSSNATDKQTVYTINCVASEATGKPQINIIGTMGQTRFRQFDPNKSSQISAVSVGDINELQIKFGTGQAGTWHLEKIDIITKEHDLT